MKAIWIAAICCIAASSAIAQPWMPTNPTGPVKFQDVVNNYRATHPAEGRLSNVADGKDDEKDDDYRFDKWAWYWQQHLDENGYMVGQEKTYTEWRHYLDTHPHTAGKTTSTSSNWIFQGPNTSPGGYSGIGRINTVAFHPTDPNTFFIGSAGGGVWKTADGGNTWAPLYDAMPVMGVSDIKINPLNPNTIYVCTGDKDGRDNYSIGVIKSTDGGATWSTTGLTWTPYDYNLARSLLINPVDTGTLIVATNVGIYKSYNGGATWAYEAAGNFEQILYSPLDTSILLGTNYVSGYSSQILRSVNGGGTWTTVTSLVNADRINIATTPANPNLVMAVASNSSNGLLGIYGSGDGGMTYAATFTNNSTCTQNLLSWDMGMPSTACNGQGWYDLCIAIDPTNADNVIIGGVNHYISADGGYTWNIATQWWSSLPGIATVHADKHFLGYNPLNNVLYATCDGGVYSTVDPSGTLWNCHTNGMGITEFYRIAIAEGVPFCLAGAQDNGTKMLNGGTYTDALGGDGMQCIIDYAAPTSVWLGSFPNGSIDITLDGGFSWNSISANIPDSNGGDWVTPFIMHPTSDNTILVGYNRIYMSADYGSTWAAISPVFSSASNINNIVVPYTNTNYIYCVTDDNVIHFSPDFGTTWSIIPHGASSAQISRIAVDPKNENILWVTYSGYYPGYKVANYNRTAGAWTVATGSLPNIPVNCIVIDTITETKYIGTETAVYYMDTTMADWALFDNNLPSVIVNDLKINYTNNELWAGTYGRGVWKSVKSDVITGVPQLKTGELPLQVLPNPNNGSFTLNTSELANRTARVALYGEGGAEVYGKEVQFDNRGRASINAGHPATGIYTATVECGGTLRKAKVVVKQ